MQPRLNLGRATPTFWGVVAMVVVAIVAVATSVLYLSPPGRSAVTFYTTDAASIRVGDLVRIAGISVGKVEAIDIEPDRVRVRTSVDHSAFVGDQSQVEVRMLTVVGGYYVNIVSLGKRPLGRSPIPVARVRMPYSLVQTLTDATKITEHVDTAPIRSGIDQLQAGLAGSNLDALRAVVDAGNSLVSTIEQQRGQVSAITGLSSEYMQALSRYRGQLTELIRKAAILEQTLVTYGVGFGGALQGLGEIGQRIKPFGEFYLGHRDEVLSTITQLQDAAGTVSDRVGPMIDDLDRVRTQMQALLQSADPAARPPLLATDLCIPVPGKTC
ncbi:virulence factor Mce family protein [Nocardia africana]|uniref:Virulence factor Mce family protein n=2 Tax=Nocardia africana TaxID=134964 RepID=A0A378X0N7_9NOCA|nr:virulence factor Mce family protein [Nocardia africana]